MTITAHNSRRFHNSKEEVDAPTCLERDRFSLRTLHPELYAIIPSSKLPKLQPARKLRPQPARKEPPPAPPVVVTPEIIVAWLKANGHATTPEIAAGLNRKRPESITRFLRQGIDGVEVKEWRCEYARKPVAVWGIKSDGETT